ncbi:serine/threonine protein kinase [Blastopirellula marina]|uniref:non-specific serine/threonine protein kinase n=1 Tax=Blastopirellula marina DSM 3645 TaxID=314230 RepID=A3ZUK3_9BACT|nr:serine/threonine-protein kinase [Blastopirellula marina]EAQ79913.1 probable protein kinase yloP-putative serine/threonine protein kinase [Blastopirellula marina DSM 3645]
MSNVTSERFIELAGRSQLIHPTQFESAVAELRAENGGALPEDVEKVADFFVAKNYITTWHREKILQGKYKGFFLSKYKLLGHLGTGGMSSVYLGEHTVMQRKVAIKVLPRNRVKDSSYLGRFHLEAQAAAQLDHPNIVRAFDVDNEGDTHYIVMEYVPGCDLQILVREKGPLEIETAAEYVAQAAEALEHAHQRGLIHRDIKPANLLLDTSGVVKVLDMGLARFTRDDATSLTLANQESVLGTADYLSPEQAVNSHKVDGRADLYSLGCSLYFLLAGHPPFPEGSLAQRIAKHQTIAPEKIRKVRPNCPASLAKICEKLMMKKPEQRYQSAKEVGEVLRNWLQQRSAGGEEELTAVAEEMELRQVRREEGKSSVITPPSMPRVAELLEDGGESNSGILNSETVRGQRIETDAGLSGAGRSKALPVARPLDDDLISSMSDPGASGVLDIAFTDPLTSAGDNTGSRTLISREALQLRMQQKEAEREKKKTRHTGQSKGGVSFNFAGIPAFIWIAIGLLFLLIGVLLVMVAKKSQDETKPQETRKSGFEASSLEAPCVPSCLPEKGVA